MAKHEELLRASSEATAPKQLALKSTGNPAVDSARREAMELKMQIRAFEQPSDMSEEQLEKAFEAQKEEESTEGKALSALKTMEEFEK
jgi:hypothetical protein